MINKRQARNGLLFSPRRGFFVIEEPATIVNKILGPLKKPPLKSYTQNSFPTALYQKSNALTPSKARPSFSAALPKSKAASPALLAEHAAPRSQLAGLKGHACRLGEMLALA